MIKRLYTRLAVVTCLLFVAVGGALVYITAATSELYSLEVTQRVNRDIALHAAEDMPLLGAQGVNEQAIQDLMHHVMFINPIVEVYLLDTQGTVLSHAAPYGAVVRDRVDMQPVRAFLAGESTLPIFGDDPRSTTGSKVFSVSPIMDGGEVAAYVYTVLNGETFDGVKGSLAESYNLRMGAATIAGSLLVAFLAGAGLFFLLTRRLQLLATAVRAYREGSYRGTMALPARASARDEIDELMIAFGDMSKRIDSQFSAQEEIDRNRRDLIANVSHDLRTPIASIQGYLETALIKELDADARREYLETAHKHCTRLNELIEELFELSRLESRSLEPASEAFPVMELVQDIVHDHELMAREKSISLSANSDDMGIAVFADLGMIHRVLENLIRNALRHTPNGGYVAINVRPEAGGVVVEVADNGEGIASHEIPHIFERFYRPDTSSSETGHGLGLAIVKRIVELHRSTVAVRSTPREGTAFSFRLPPAASIASIQT